MSKFIFTCGDVNGIGPEIVLKTLQRIHNKRSKDQFIFICPRNVFINTHRSLHIKFPFEIINKIEELSSSRISILALPDGKINAGIATKDSGKISFKALELSYKLLSKNLADAVVTAPISKFAINKAGYDFSGQTEMFANWTKSKNYLMTFLSENINAGLVTTHIPIKQVSKAINKTKISNALKIIIQTAKVDLGIEDVKIAVLGLNPHSGENGLLGKEEQEIIEPVLKLKEFKTIVEGPFPTDGFFAREKFKDFIFVLGMYHDQVLIPYKMIDKGLGVNFTAGLPIVRTSPDHGSAFDIAGKNIADDSSFYSAYQYAKKIVSNRNKYNSA